MVLLSPLFIIVSILIYIKMGRPIHLDRLEQDLNEKLFTIYKFRTMSDIRTLERSWAKVYLPRMELGGPWNKILGERFNLRRPKPSFLGMEALTFKPSLKMVPKTGGIMEAFW